MDFEKVKIIKARRRRIFLGFFKAKTRILLKKTDLRGAPKRKNNKSKLRFLPETLKIIKANMKIRSPKILKAGTPKQSEVGGKVYFPPPTMSSELKPSFLLQLTQDYNPVSNSRIPMCFWNIFGIWHVWIPSRTLFWTVVEVLAHLWIFIGYNAAKLEMQPAAARFRQACP